MTRHEEKQDKWLRRCLSFVGWFCPPPLLEGIEGDLTEQYASDVAASGKWKARRKLAGGTLKFFHYEIISRNKFGLRLINTIMLGNYLRVATRNIQKRKMYSAINAFGLSIGIAFCMLIWLFIRDERSFDQFQQNKGQIVVIEENSYNYWNPETPEEDRWMRSVWIQSGLLLELKKELPEVEFGTRLNDGDLVVKQGDRVFKEDDVKYVDGDFFRMFSFPLLQGNRDKLFSNTLEVVITPEIATKYFDKADPMGQTLIIDDKSFVVAGVIEAPSANSSIDFTILVPQENRRNYERQIARWGSFNTPTFVQLRAGTDRVQFNSNVNRVMDKHMKDMLVNWRKEGNLPADQKMLEYGSVPLLSLHMDKDVGWHKASSIQYSYILGGIALLILIIACINYISLALTTSAARRTEVGIRKVVGALRNQLLYQFAFESIVLAVLSSLAAVGLAVLFIPYFNDFTDKGISISWPIALQLLGLSIALGTVVGGISGAYPALFLSRYVPAVVLKGGHTKVQAGFSRPLVVLQFALSAFLIISSAIMYKQMRFVATRELGFNKDAVLVVPTQAQTEEVGAKMVAQLRTRLEREQGIVEVGGVDMSFNKGWSRNGFKINGVNKSCYVYAVDPYYIPALEMELVAGRNFDAHIPADSDAVIVNEAVVRDMKWDDPIGQYYNWKEDTVGMGALVIGVVKDYHYRSLEAPIEPLMMVQEWGAGTAMIRLASGDVPAAMEKVSKAWRELFPDMPYEYSFLEDDVAAQYDSYERWINITGFATAFAIVISCLGLFGLAGINAVNRTREIGIRKVMGADVSTIFILLNKQYVVLSMIAFAAAIPLSYYALTKWFLDDFKFKVTLGWEVFAVSMGVGLFVAILTVSYHGIKAAMLNPAETLKYE
jgi:putative ABC transport system permease protein